MLNRPNFFFFKLQIIHYVLLATKVLELKTMCYIVALSRMVVPLHHLLFSRSNMAPSSNLYLSLTLRLLICYNGSTSFCILERILLEA